jgi:hypothetical protein
MKRKKLASDFISFHPRERGIIELEGQGNKDCPDYHKKNDHKVKERDGKKSILKGSIDNIGSSHWPTHNVPRL